MFIKWMGERVLRCSSAPQIARALTLYFCLNASAFAGCNVYGMTPATIATVALPLNLSIPRDSAVGTILFDSQWVATPKARANCGSVGDNTAGYVVAMKAVPGMTNVYETGVTGIGIKASWYNGMDTSHTMDNATAVMTSPKAVWGSHIAQLYNYYTGVFRVQLIKTGQVLPGKFNLPVKLATGDMDTSEINVLQLSNNTAAVSAPACSVQQSAISVKMPVGHVSDMPSIGSTSGDTGFNISIDCPSPVSVAMTMTDAANPNNVSNTLSLNSASSAKGVGYQIVYNGGIISYGPDSAIINNLNQFNVGTVGLSGTLTIPFTARYVRTGPITRGTADANATFTMSYQ
jgi:type 1 fimbria pilin